MGQEGGGGVVQCIGIEIVGGSCAQLLSFHFANLSKVVCCFW